MPRALLSIYDKNGLVEFARQLADLGWELVASGGTAAALTAVKLPVIPVDALTGHPEMLGGRVKTLHPAVHAAILARDTTDDLHALTTQGYVPIDLVACTLYPFQDTVADPAVTLDGAIEQIDIGGVTLIRAAAKNFARVLVITDPADYTPLIDALRTDRVDTALRRSLAAKAFSLTTRYDSAIFSYLTGSQSSINTFTLRYGENPHQQGQFLSSVPGKVLGGELLGGKELSYNNLLDVDSAYSSVEQFSAPTVVIVKHLSPCGIASAPNVATAFMAALASDPVSAFGGVIAVNVTVTDAFVDALGDLFVEVIAAPAFSDGALERLRSKRKNCRLLRMEPLPPHASQNEQRSVRGGMLTQSKDVGDPADTAWRVVTQRQPTSAELVALRFAWKACQCVKSNAIVLAMANGEGDSALAATVGIGGGLSSRLDAAELAVKKAGERAKGSVLASDAFFPFPDGLEAAIRAGITAVVQPGGAMRDDQVIAAADAANLAMIFTGVRHFRH
jgi:phosphoribosylaminoimidazolecarboxamide formyltransferase/IMP cyclohydrolase